MSNYGKAPLVPPFLPSGLLQPFSYLTSLSTPLHSTPASCCISPAAVVLAISVASVAPAASADYTTSAPFVASTASIASTSSVASPTPFVASLSAAAIFCPLLLSPSTCLLHHVSISLPVDFRAVHRLYSQWSGKHKVADEICTMGPHRSRDHGIRVRTPGKRESKTRTGLQIKYELKITV